MLKTIEAVNNVVNNFIWGIPAMICIIGVGLSSVSEQDSFRFESFLILSKIHWDEFLISLKPQMDRSPRSRLFVPHLPEQ